MKQLLFCILLLFGSIAGAEPDWTNAEVIRVEPSRQRIVLKHESIKSIGMDAMTMLFDGEPKLPLENYKAGDKVRFQVRINDGVLEVIALEKTP